MDENNIVWRIKKENSKDKKAGGRSGGQERAPREKRVRRYTLQKRTRACITNMERRARGGRVYS